MPNAQSGVIEVSEALSTKADRNEVEEKLRDKVGWTWLAWSASLFGMQWNKISIAFACNDLSC